MSIRSTFLIVLFAAFFSPAILVQSLENVLVDPPQSDTDAKIKPETRDGVLRAGKCEGDRFPLFGDSTCISRSAYTGIFLTSIILACLSFLMIITLAILYFVRLRKSGSRDDDAESNVSVRSRASSSSKSSTSSVATVDRTADERLVANNTQQSYAPAAVRAPVRGGAPVVKSAPNPRAAASRPPPVVDDDDAF